MLEKYRLVAFDLDGTLAITSLDYPKVLLPRVLQKVNADPNVSGAQIAKFWLEGERSKTVREEFSCDPDKFWQVYIAEDKIKERLEYTWPDPEAAAVLRAIKENGQSIIVITDSFEHLALPSVDLLPAGLVSKVFSIPALNLPSKPDPLSFQHCLDTYEVRPDQAVYIGNSFTDGLYAENAGVDFIQIVREDHPLTTSLNGYGRKIMSLKELVKGHGDLG